MKFFKKRKYGIAWNDNHRIASLELIVARHKMKHCGQVDIGSFP
jgi:hypothetical protein